MRPWFTLLSLVVSTLFLFFPESGEIGFLMDETKLSYRQYVWIISEHVSWLLFSLGVWLDPKPYRLLMGTFFFICLMDVVGFILSFDDPLRDWPITWNILKIGLFVLAMKIDKVPL